MGGCFNMLQTIFSVCNITAAKLAQGEWTKELKEQHIATQDKDTCFLKHSKIPSPSDPKWSAMALEIKLPSRGPEASGRSCGERQTDSTHTFMAT